MRAISASPASPTTATQKLVTIAASVAGVAAPCVSASAKPTPHHHQTPATPSRIARPQVAATTHRSTRGRG